MEDVSFYDNDCLKILSIGEYITLHGGYRCGGRGVPPPPTLNVFWYIFNLLGKKLHNIFNQYSLSRNEILLLCGSYFGPWINDNPPSLTVMDYKSSLIHRGSLTM